MRVLRNAIRSCKRAPRLSEAVAVMEDRAASTIATPSLWVLYEKFGMKGIAGGTNGGGGKRRGPIEGGGEG